MCVAVLLAPRESFSQRTESVTAGIAAVTTVAAAFASINQLEESLEYEANNFVVRSISPKYYNLRLMDFEGKKLSDVGPLSMVSFALTISEFNAETGSLDVNSKSVLFMVGTPGWISPTGLDVTYISWYKWTKSDWENLMWSFADIASPVDLQSLVNSGELEPLWIPVCSKAKPLDCANASANHFLMKNPNTLYDCWKISDDKEPISFCRLDRNGMTSTFSSEHILPFFSISGDDYILGKLDDSKSLLLNERTMNIYFDEAGKSVQLQRSLINEISDFLMQ